jgi:Protein of unknown function (DUF1822)
MINFPNCTRDFIETFPETIELETEAFDRARVASDRPISESRQWQVYLTILAISALETWLKARVRDKRITSENCTLFQPKYADFLDVATPVRVGDFHICILAMESFVDDVVTIPKAAIELPEFAAHFYIAIEILYEEEEAIVRGILRRERLLQFYQSQPPTTDWDCEVPLAGFDPHIDRLLYDCRYLDPQDLPLPCAAPIPDWTREQLHEFLLLLHSDEPEGWRQMSWERGQIALRYPQLRDVDVAKLPPEALNSLSALLAYLQKTPIVRDAVRLSQWLRRSFEEGWQQLEEIATPLQLSPVRGGLRKATNPDELAAVIALLQPDRPEDTRCKAAGVLGEIGAGHPEAVTALTELLHTTQAEATRWEAALSLGKLAPDLPEAGVKRARLIDLGAQLNGYQVALVVAIVPKADGRFGVWLEVQPARKLPKLPPELKLSVLSSSGKVRMEAESRRDETGGGKDVSISQYFSIGVGKRFQVRVSLGDASMTENFLT